MSSPCSSLPRLTKNSSIMLDHSRASYSTLLYYPEVTQAVVGPKMRCNQWEKAKKRSEIALEGYQKCSIILEPSIALYYTLLSFITARNAFQSAKSEQVVGKQRKQSQNNTLQCYKKWQHPLKSFQGALIGSRDLLAHAEVERKSAMHDISLQSCFSCLHCIGGVQKIGDPHKPFQDILIYSSKVLQSHK